MSAQTVRRRSLGAACLVGASMVVVQACRFAMADDDGPAELSHVGVDGVFDVPREELSRADDLALPYKATVVGSKLVVIDLAADSAVHVLDRTTGRLWRSFGRRGEGPGEFKTAWSLDPVPQSGSALWVYDFDLHRVTYVDLRDDFFRHERLGERIVNLASDASVLGLVRTDRDELLSVGLFPAGRLAAFDGDGNKLRTVGDLPPGARRMPPAVRQHAYQATLVSGGSRRLLAAAPRHASGIEIFRSDGSLVTTAEGPLTVEPDYRSSDARGFVMRDESRFGYVDAAATGEFILGLFSGRTLGEYEDRATFGRYVHIFDWSGRFLGAVRLEVDAIAMAVDEAASTLYAVEWDPTPTIASYDLSDFAGVLRSGSAPTWMADD